LTIRTIVALLLLASCTPPPPAPLVAPQWDRVPSGVIDVLCTRMRDDAITDVAVVKTTQRIVTPQALAVLGASYGKQTSNDRMTEALAGGQRTIPIETKSSVCTSVTPIERMDGRVHADAMILEISAPLANPFARNEAGLFARVSLGGQHPAWYWVPLGTTGGMWMVGQALPLMGL
jgi:hypothetical protein